MTQSDDAPPCEGCGFVYDEDEHRDAAVAVRAEARGLASVLVANPDAAARRRAPDVWSPLEYGCHVRDVLLIQRERVLQARREDTPIPAPMGREERVEHDGYDGQDPRAVARQLVDAADLFANVLDLLDEGAWSRRLVYGYPTIAERSLRWVAVHTLHEVHHHRIDAAG